jgi:hypothetical protein
MHPSASELLTQVLLSFWWDQTRGGRKGALLLGGWKQLVSISVESTRSVRGMTNIGLLPAYPKHLAAHDAIELQASSAAGSLLSGQHSMPSIAAASALELWLCNELALTAGGRATDSTIRSAQRARSAFMRPVWLPTDCRQCIIE